MCPLHGDIPHEERAQAERSPGRTWTIRVGTAATTEISRDSSAFGDSEMDCCGVGKRSAARSTHPDRWEAFGSGSFQVSLQHLLLQR